MPGTPSRAPRLLIAAAILISCVGCDQATKSLATSVLREAPPRSYLSETVRFEYALNPGGFLSLGGNLAPEVRRWFFVGFNACLLLGVAWFLWSRWNTRLAVFIPATCILAGGIGNLIDRVFQNGLVTDFIIVGVGPVRTGIFNVADMAVLFGALAIVYATWGEPTKTPAAPRGEA